MTSETSYDTPADYAAALGHFLETDERVAPYRGYRPPSLEASFDHLRGLQQLLYDDGWSRLGWPESSGGLGGDPLLRAALFETLWERDVIVPEPYSTLEILVPVLFANAPDLGNRFFGRLLRGDDVWAQAFSEPDAGSDMAALRTRMEPDGDGYRVTGQKVWSSYGHLAQRSMMLVRTGEPGHRGITMVLIDLDQPEIEVRPIKCEDGENHLSEIFLDGAYVEGDRLVGQLGQGWAMAMYMLQWERGAWAWLQQGRFHNRMEYALRQQHGRPSAASALGRAYVGASALRVHTRSTVRRLAKEEALGPEVSVDKLLLVDAEVPTWDAIRAHLGPVFDFDDELHWLRSEYFFSRAAPIYGGSQEIQRSLVAQRVLGMPRD